MHAQSTLCEVEGMQRASLAQSLGELWSRKGAGVNTISFMYHAGRDDGNGVVKSL